MLKIRLQRIGRKNNPSFRVVLVEHTMRPKGEFIEILGSYNKTQKQKSLNKERILYWISKGAQVSPTMHNLLVDEKIIDKAKVKAWKPKKREEAKGDQGEDKGTPEGNQGEPVESPVETPVETPLETPSENKVEETKTEEPKKEEAPAEPNIDIQPKTE